VSSKILPLHHTVQGQNDIYCHPEVALGDRRISCQTRFFFSTYINPCFSAKLLLFYIKYDIMIVGGNRKEVFVTKSDERIPVEATLVVRRGDKSHTIDITHELYMHEVLEDLRTAKDPAARLANFIEKMSKRPQHQCQRSQTG